MFTDMIKKYRPYGVLLLLCGALVFLSKESTHVAIEYGVDEDPYAISGELFVSPYGVEDKLFEVLGSAKYDIDFWLYALSYNKAEQLMKNLSAMGVVIRRIGEDKPYGGWSKDFDKMRKRLTGEGVQVKSDADLGLPTNFNHTKTFIIDGAKILISTANLTYSSIYRNREYWFVTENKHVVSNIIALFDRDRNGGTVNPDEIHPAVLFCPINCREKIEGLMQGAESSIWVQAQYLADERVEDILVEQMNAGVDVRVQVSDNQSDEGIDEIAEILNGEGVQIIDPDDGNLPYIHAKNVLIDDTILIVGSMNLSSNALDNNREIGIITSDVDVVSVFRRQFERDWGGGK